MRRSLLCLVALVRVTPVEIPDLLGESAEDAVERLEGLGLEVETRRRGGLLDDLLPGGLDVCRLDPPEGTDVRPGATVTVEAARSC